MKLGLVIGKFQPLHNGHVATIEKAIEENDKVLVLVGSANGLPNYQNPFPVDTRIQLIQDQFDVIVKGLDDYPNEEQWAEDVTSRVNTIQEDPSKVTLYTGNMEYDESLFLYGISPCDLLTKDILGTWYRGSSQAMEHVPEVTKVLLENKDDEYTRLREEYFLCTVDKEEALLNHPYTNPIEPVVHAMLVQENQMLLVKRSGVRGNGQWALPGGYLRTDETTRGGALRELRETTGIDLLTQPRAAEVACAVEENMNGLSTRTLGINYCYAVYPEETLDIVGDAQWFPLEDVANGDMPLFYNHTTVVRRLLERIK